MFAFNKKGQAIDELRRIIFKGGSPASHTFMSFYYPELLKTKEHGQNYKIDGQHTFYTSGREMDYETKNI